LTELKHLLTMSDPQFEDWLIQERERQDREWKEVFRRGVEISIPGPDGGMYQSLADMKEKIESQGFVPDRTHLFFTETDLRAARAGYKVQQAMQLKNLEADPITIQPEAYRDTEGLKLPCQRCKDGIVLIPRAKERPYPIVNAPYCVICGQRYIIDSKLEGYELESFLRGLNETSS
jgi:hypothetical protein